MPIKKSAKKALRQTIKRTAVNRKIKDAIRKIKNDLAKKIAAKDKKGAVEIMSRVSQILDKAAKNHILTANAAARYKSRLQKAINKIG